MPVLLVEPLPGIGPEQDRKMMRKLAEAIDEAHDMGDALKLNRLSRRRSGGALRVASHAWLGFEALRCCGAAM